MIRVPISVAVNELSGICMHFIAVLKANSWPFRVIFDHSSFSCGVHLGLIFGQTDYATVNTVVASRCFILDRMITAIINYRLIAEAARSFTFGFTDKIVLVFSSHWPANIYYVRL